MQKITHGNVYAYMLDEAEWYGQSDQRQEELRHGVVQEASEAGCRFANIVVKPDVVLSLSPERKSHIVFRHTFPVNAEREFLADLASACGHALENGLTVAQITTHMRSYMEGKLS